MRENKRIKLKYVATSFSSAQKQSDVFESGKYEVYGASGLVGYLDTYGCDTPYIGIVKDGAGVGRTNIYKSHTNLLGTMAYIIPRDPDSTNLHFLQYAIAALDLGNTAGDKATIPHIYFSVYGNQYILDVPIAVQNLIADNLDDKCTQVNALVANVQAQIEKLKAYKQSLITEVVSKGLDPTVPMKDSGVEWIGKIPAHWEIKRGKALFQECDARSTDSNEELLTVSQYTGITPRSQKNVNMFEALTLEGYKICEIGNIAANTMWLWAGAIGVSEYRGVISPSYNVYQQREGHYVSKYLDYLLRAPMLAHEYASRSTGIRASRLRLYPKDFLNIVFPVPPIDEQKMILQALTERFEKVEKLIAIKQSKIEKLNKYKQSLIYEYVTGKKEV